MPWDRACLYVLGKALEESVPSRCWMGAFPFITLEESVPCEVRLELPRTGQLTKVYVHVYIHGGEGFWRGDDGPSGRVRMWGLYGFFFFIFDFFGGDVM